MLLARLSPALLVSLLSLLATGCKHDDSAPVAFDVHVKNSQEIPMLVHIVWNSDEAASSWVEWTDEDGEHSTPVHEGSTHHDHPLYGLYPLSDVEYTAYMELDDGTVLQSPGTFQTPNVPSEFPTFEIQTYDEDAAYPVPFFLIVLEGEVPLIAAIDREGNWRWAYQLPDNATNSLGNSITSHADFLDDGLLLYNRYDFDTSEGSADFHVINLNGKEVEAYPARLHHHSFCRKDEDTIAYIKMDIRDYEDPSRGTVPVAGDAIVELNLSTNQTRTVFSTWDWMEPQPTDLSNVEVIPGVLSWTHSNSIYYYPDRGTYLFSMGFIGTVLEIDAETGEVVDSFGRYGDYTCPDVDRAFSFQHDVQWVEDDHLLMMSQNGPGNTEDIALEYSLDDDSMQLQEVWSYGRGLGYDAPIDTEAHRLPNGNTLISWTMQGHVVEVTPENEVVWELQCSLGSAIIRILPFNDFYAPEIF